MNQEDDVQLTEEGFLITSKRPQPPAPLSPEIEGKVREAAERAVGHPCYCSLPFFECPTLHQVEREILALLRDLGVR